MPILASISAAAWDAPGSGSAEAAGATSPPSVPVFMGLSSKRGGRTRRPLGGRDTSSLGLGCFELLVVVLRVLGQRVGVQVLVAAIAGELLPVGLGLLDHLFHDFFGLGPATL